MKPFTFTYQGQTQEAFADHFTEDLNNRYGVVIYGDAVVITPGAIRALGDKAIWVQVDGPVKANSLIQAIGEGLEAAGIF